MTAFDIGVATITFPLSIVFASLGVREPDRVFSAIALVAACVSLGLFGYEAAILAGLQP